MNYLRKIALVLISTFALVSQDLYATDYCYADMRSFGGSISKGFTRESACALAPSQKSFWESSRLSGTTCYVKHTSGTEYPGTTSCSTCPGSTVLNPDTWTCDTACPAGRVLNSSTGHCDRICTPPLVYDKPTDSCVDSCPAPNVWDPVEQICEEGCKVGDISPDCPRVDCVGDFDHGSVGWGQSCPENLDISDYGCITDGDPHICDPDYPPNGTGETSSGEGFDSFPGQEKIKNSDGTSNVNPGDDGSQYGTTSNSTASGNQIPEGVPGGSIVPTGGVNSPMSDFCTVNPSAPQCSEWTPKTVSDVCRHGGAPDPVIGCDYVYTPPSTRCPSGQVPDMYGVCKTPPTIVVSEPTTEYVPPTQSPPAVYPPVSTTTNNTTNTTTTTINQGQGGEVNVEVKVEFPEMDGYTGSDKTEKDYFDDAALDADIEQLKTEFTDTIAQIKALVSGSLSIGAVGSLPCFGPFTYGEITKQWCLSEYDSALSKIGPAILFLSFFASAIIIFRR